MSKQLKSRPKVKKRSRLSAEESMTHIIEVALSLFAENGFAQTSIQSVADKCNLSQTAVLYHFPSKTKLIASVLRAIVEHNGRIVAAFPTSEQGGLKQLERHFHANLAWAVENPREARLILLLYYMGAFERSFAETYVHILKGARKKIERFLTEAIHEKTIASPADIALVAEILHDALLGGIVNVVSVTPVDAVDKKAGEDPFKVE